MVPRWRCSWQGRNEFKSSLEGKYGMDGIGRLMLLSWWKRSLWSDRNRYSSQKRMTAIHTRTTEMFAVQVRQNLTLESLTLSSKLLVLKEEDYLLLRHDEKPKSRSVRLRTNKRNHSLDMVTRCFWLPSWMIKWDSFWGAFDGQKRRFVYANWIVDLKIRSRKM